MLRKKIVCMKEYNDKKAIKMLSRLKGAENKFAQIENLRKEILKRKKG